MHESEICFRIATKKSLIKKLEDIYMIVDINSKLDIKKFEEEIKEYKRNSFKRKGVTENDKKGKKRDY